MRILVTGGAGFIGSHVVDALVSRGHKVTVLDDLSTGKRENLNRQAAFVKGKVETLAAERLVRRLRPEAIFNFAAQKDVRFSVSRPAEDALINVVGLLRLVQGALPHGLKRLVLASTGGAIYGGAKKLPTPEDYPAHPFSPYGVSKLASELYLHSYRHAGGLPAVSLRFANVYGPRQDPKSEAGVVAIFARRLLRGQRPVITGDGEQSRDFVYIDDVVRACLAALTTKHLGVYNIGTGVETNINELARMLNLLVGSELQPVYAPAVAGEERRSALAIGLAKKFLGWKPRVALAQGLAKTIEWQIARS
ncbi:NAD-dependent epimerase/dehydratase family protein [Patescibacteria group bacterium]|nr:MAG: NAD-dependent epimerase/dehydratase family protein [Patescibacteria group bacterium]